MNEDEVDIVIDHRSDGLYQARALHLATGTIKISDFQEDKQSAIDDALEGLEQLVNERMKGLGDK